MAETADALFVRFQEALAGRYSLERELGRGGMGVVYLAREVSLDRLVAIKLLPPELAAQHALRERFLREARTAAKLSHPNIIPIFAVDNVAGFVFYVMAYVNGETLARRVATRGAIPPAEATRILREVAWALAYAHAQGVVHRDIKPENILVEAGTGRAMVADFGIARRTGTTGQTRAGELLGTPDYMSPEQAAGEALDGRSDLYSLGVVGFYLLTGRLPFTGPTAQAMLVQHLTQPAPAVTSLADGLPPALAGAVDRCLRKPPDERFATGEALADALGTALQAPRDVPVAIRVFLDRRRNLVTILPIYLGAAPLVGSLTMRLAQGAGEIASIGLILLLLAVPPVISLRRLRRILQQGYDADDVASGVKILFERKREEFLYEHGPTPSVQERVLRLVARGGLYVTAGTVALCALNVLPGEFLGLTIPGIYAAGIGGVLSQKWRRLRSGSSWWARFWSGRVGHWLARVAGMGLKGRVVAAGRPTELAIGSAADALYAELPKAVRRAIGDFPQAVRSLEGHAQQIRARIAELDQLMAEAHQPLGRPAAQAERDRLLDDLHTMRDEAQVRLSETVTALETLRLDLLRLRAGAGTVESITTDLAAARELGDRADQLLAGHQEVRRLLRPSPVTAGPPAASD